MQTNYAGLTTKAVPAERQLRRAVMANMLWEDQFYIDGQDAANIITDLVSKVSSDTVANIAIEARTKFKLRHVPLLLTRALAKHGQLKADTLAEVIQRPDEMGEFLSIYWKDGKSPISNQVKRGLAKAFTKFNEYQLAKWDKNSANISIRDVMFLTHPKPQTTEQTELFKRIASNEMKTPDTWEVELSGGANKKETFERLMRENKLGALAFIRNLRNMVQSGVSTQLIQDYGMSVNPEKVLPFRFIAAVRMVPEMSNMLQNMMFRCIQGHEKLKGRTLLLVDVSGSMFGTKVSGKSDLDRFDAAGALAMLCREICEDAKIFTFSDKLVEINPSQRGFSLVEAMQTSQSHRGTDLHKAVSSLNVRDADRLIVFTDEQSQTKPFFRTDRRNYVINVGAYSKGISDSHAIGIDGFSEAVIDYILELEKSDY